MIFRALQKVQAEVIWATRSGTFLLGCPELFSVRLIAVAEAVGEVIGAVAGSWCESFD